MYNSLAKQDIFVDKLLENKTNGTYIDVGSHHAKIANNTEYFTRLGWNGICIEIDQSLNSSYEERNNTVLINEDARLIDYRNILKDFDKVIDYLSLDVDTTSLEVLEKLPFNEHTFSVITIEHDFYIHGDQYRARQREILSSHGYQLICGNVFVEQEGFEGKMCPFEDWWIKPELFDNEKIKKIICEDKYPSQIIGLF